MRPPVRHRRALLFSLFPNRTESRSRPFDWETCRSGYCFLRYMGIHNRGDVWEIDRGGHRNGYRSFSAGYKWRYRPFYTSLSKHSILSFLSVRAAALNSIKKGWKLKFPSPCLCVLNTTLSLRIWINLYSWPFPGLHIRRPAP